MGVEKTAISSPLGTSHQNRSFPGDIGYFVSLRLYSTSQVEHRTKAFESAVIFDQLWDAANFCEVVFSDHAVHDHVVICMKYPVRGPSPIAVHGPIGSQRDFFAPFEDRYFTTQRSTITGPSPIAAHAPTTVHGS